jgi:hypothetical protein
MTKIQGTTRDTRVNCCDDRTASAAAADDSYTIADAAAADSYTIADVL